jgi:hypothetical protein
LTEVELCEATSRCSGTVSSDTETNLMVPDGQSQRAPPNRSVHRSRFRPCLLRTLPTMIVARTCNAFASARSGLGAAEEAC